MTMLRRTFRFTLLSSFVAGVLSLGTAGAADSGGHWINLFDGKSTDHWRGFKRDAFPSKGWSIQDGALRADPKGEVVDLVTKEKFSSFELELEWKVAPGANSGIMFRVSEEFDAPWHTGPELQVLDDDRHADGKSPKTSAGSLYALIAPEGKQLKPVGEWNTFRLVVDGNHAEHWLNGKKVVQYQLNSPELTAMIAQSKFKGMPRFAKQSEGHIVIQHHHDEVWFRHINIRRLPAK